MRRRSSEYGRSCALTSDIFNSWLCFLGYTQLRVFNSIVSFVEFAVILATLAYDVQFWIASRELLPSTLATVAVLDAISLKLFVLFFRWWYNSRCSILNTFGSRRSSDFIWIGAVAIYVGIFSKFVCDSLSATLRLISRDDLKFFAEFCELYTIVIRAQFVSSIAIVCRSIQHFNDKLRLFGKKCVLRGRAHEISDRLSDFNDFVAPLLRAVFCAYFSFVVCQVAGTLFLTFSCNNVDGILLLMLGLISIGFLFYICYEGEKVAGELVTLRRIARKKQLCYPDLRSEMFIQEAMAIRVTKRADLGMKAFFGFLGFSMTFAVIVFQAASAIVTELCKKWNFTDEISAQP